MAQAIPGWMPEVDFYLNQGPHTGEIQEWRTNRPDDSKTVPINSKQPLAHSGQNAIHS